MIMGKKVLYLLQISMIALFLTACISHKTVAILTDFTGSVEENATIGTEIGAVMVLDTGNTVITAFTLSDSTNFEINALGTIKTKTLLDYENISSYNLTVTGTNMAGDSTAVKVDIEVTDVADVKAVLADSIGSIGENAASGAIVGTVTIVSSGDSVITAITLRGTGNENFEVSTTGAITVKSGAVLDYETVTKYNLTVIASNSAGDSSAVKVDINVTDYLNPFQIAKLIASDAEGGDRFGSSVSSSGDYIVVGSVRGNEGTGSAYLFKKESDGKLAQIAKIQASDAEARDYFGTSVAISGDTIVVGAYGEDTGGSYAGSAYVFKRNSDAINDVTQIVKIQASDVEAYGSFGNSVAISGDYIVVGSERKDMGANCTGSAYLFKKQSDGNFTQIAQIKANDPEASDWFGSSVAIFGDTIVVGVKHGDEGMGSAYVFKRNSDAINDVTQIAKIKASDAEVYDRFGSSVAISGDTIVVGSEREGSDTGSAYVFKRNSDDINDTTQIAKIQASDAEADDRFGNSVAISGDYIVVGAYRKDGATGSAYVFKRNSDDINDTMQIVKIQASDAQTDDRFGLSVSISGDTIVVGAENEDTKGKYTGSAYVFDLEPIDRAYIYNAPLSVINYNEQLSDTYVYSFDAASPSGGSIDFSLSGVDAGSFLLIDNNLSFEPKADYENPLDDDINNDYNITITATDRNSHATSINVDILVKDKYYFEIAKIQASDAEADDRFGNSVAISGDYVVVGAKHEDEATGSVYLFKKQSDGTLTQIAKIQAIDVEAGDYFGTSVAICGDTIVVGAVYESSQGKKAGSAYVYKRNSDAIDDITQIAKIQSSAANPSFNQFGASVSISGDYIIVGAYGEDGVKGAAYLFKRNSDVNVTEIAKIQASDGEAWDFFGSSVSISENYIVVGSDNRRSNTDAGSAYVFKRNSDVKNDVVEIAKIQASDGEDGNYFGNYVAISEDTIVVGAYGKDSAYVYKRNSDDINDTTEIAKIKASDTEVFDSFGDSVSISRDYIVVGAYNKNSAYVFKLNSDNSIIEIEKIQAHDTEAYDNFGKSVAISGDTIVVGADHEDTGESDAGSAYIFEKDTNQAP